MLLVDENKLTWETIKMIGKCYGMDGEEVIRETWVDEEKMMDISVDNVVKGIREYMGEE